ncbi:hypothetical protein WOLCODRAFT_101533 [Wolfiporia cocos MD-104 SS10]|uniref:Uncharacterized protein n=1 Tax=Wolfiporia cocos (strain MD-104) TaxID=742152 RepID=A0A2H3JIS6_WOLCO|nr:hypothetical protein WOLCODRAFT_101533 [Wolfiporia cocos MD-104 SS10]
MGPTGCGKTTFVNLACESYFVIGHGLQSCTAKIQLASLALSGHAVTVIDSPGFDDTERSQVDVLTDIATFLQQTYERQQKLAGVIYIHKITDNRLGWTAIENYRLFSEICGPDAMKNVLIVTNMWSDIAQKTRYEREQQLQNKFFKQAIDRGARMRRHDGSRESALNILCELLENHEEVLQVQDEMVDQLRPIPETQAGAELNRVLERMQQRHQAEIARMQQEMQEDLERVTRELQRLRKQLEQVEREREKLQEIVGRLKEDGGAPEGKERKQLKKEPWWKRVYHRIVD